MLDLPLPILAFLFGILSILTPCVLPVIPVIAAYAAKAGKFVPIALVSGLSISFVVMGIVASTFGQIMSAFNDLLHHLAGLIMVIMGLYILFEEHLSPLLMKVPSSGIFDRLRANVGGEINGAGGGFLLGLTLGVVWVPCIGPMLGSILAMVAADAEFMYGSLLLLLYSAGMAIPFLAIAYGSNASVNRIKGLSSHLPAIKMLSGIVLILAGIYFGLGN
ncbi:cytochrome c biogenesis protein CcdA [Methanosarcinales archaeon]|nr:MAG: cytochrome c biogenesis protein CcdA [Methanosarcinales archaeon]